MLVLSARFALLAAFCSLAATPFSSRWGVDAAAIQPRPLDHDYCRNVTSNRPSAQYVLPLPLQSKTKQFKVVSHYFMKIHFFWLTKNFWKRTHKWLYSNPVALFSDIVFTRLKRDDNMPGEACRFRKHGDYQSPAGTPVTRRSVLIPDNHGSEYVVSHSRRPVRRRRRRSKARTLSRIKEMPHSRREQDAKVGYVSVTVCNILTHLMARMLTEHKSPVYNSATGREIAKLFAAPKGHEAWILYASTTNQTQFQMVNAPASVETTNDVTPVTLEMGAPGETRTCATYNSSPPQDGSDTDSENMTMEPCADRATPETGHKSQIFMYNGTSGTLEPTWNSADGANTTAASPSDSTSSSNATATPSAVQAAATLFANRADTPQNPTKQNSTQAVTLVFTPTKSMVTDVGIQENSTTAGTTMTMTKTVTVFNVESMSTRVPSSTSNTAAQVTATSSALDVQLVGPLPNATGTTTIESTSVSTSSSTATGLTDASAIASRIAASASSASADVFSTTISSSTDSASPSSTQVAQRRENEKSVASPAGTEPYTWVFKAEQR